MVGNRKSGERLQHRVPKELDAWAAAYAKNNRKGLRSKNDVTTMALREFREREEAAEMRRQVYEAWVANGRPWPPPPGLAAPAASSDAEPQE